MKRILTFVLATIAVIPPVTMAQIYQWKDENGKTIISDKPPVGHVRQQRKLDSSSETPASAVQKTTADRELEFRKRQKDSLESTEKSRKEQQAATEKQQFCEDARRQLQSLQSGERIAMRDDKGERYFLEDAQREQEIAKIRKSMQGQCGE